MKKTTLVLLVFALIALSCGNEKKNETANNANFTASTKTQVTTSGPIDVRENMFITQINDINLNYKTYLGRDVKIQGMFKHLSWDGKDYYYVFRKTPGCCGDDGEIGFELSWDPNFQGTKTTDDGRTYPKQNDWVEVQGKLSNYEKSGFPFLYLALSDINVMDNRGAEFVAR